jgi:predicted glycosyltransferase
VRVWIDIENPPQVRYLLPCKSHLERRGDEVVLTARDDGSTFALLESEGATFEPIGRQASRTKAAKVVGVLARAHALSKFVASAGRPAFLLSASRPAALAAWRRGVPSFYIGDYEFSNVTIQRRTGTYLMFPDVIDPAVFRRRGMRADRLIPFRGLKEDISFAGLPLETIRAHPFGAAGDSATTLLFRPPGEKSHYHSEKSTDLADELLGFLAEHESVQVIFSPRYQHQARMLERFTWARPPVVLREPIHFVALLKGVDLVVSSGGTMIREAAYLGVPAYSIFRSEIGAVDRYLESVGRIRFIASPADFSTIELERRAHQPFLAMNPALVEELVDGILERIPASPSP